MLVDDTIAISGIVALAGGIVGLWRYYATRESRIITTIKAEHHAELKERDSRLSRLEIRVEALEETRIKEFRDHAAALERLISRTSQVISDSAHANADNSKGIRELARAIAQQTEAIRQHLSQHQPPAPATHLPDPHPLASEIETHPVTKKNREHA